jgi:hypothetical protein
LLFMLSGQGQRAAKHSLSQDKVRGTLRWRIIPGTYGLCATQRDWHDERMACFISLFWTCRFSALTKLHEQKTSG